MNVSACKYWAILAVTTSIACSLTQIVTAQEAGNLFSQPQGSAGRGLEFGLRKLNVTYVFTGNADLLVPVLGGQLRWINLYQGSVFQTSTTAVRDDQAAQVGYDAPISPWLSAIVRTSWIYSSDSRNVGLSSMQRLNGVVGLRYQPDPSFSSEAFGGMESTTQLGSQATGPIVGAVTEVHRLEVDEWDVSARALADWHMLDAQRTNSDVDLSASVSRNFLNVSTLRLGSHYTSLNRQYFTTVEGGTTPLTVEGRDEDRFEVDADITYAATEALALGLTSHVESNGIGRSYNEPVPGVAFTAADRRLNEVVFDLEGRIQLRFATSELTVGGSLYQRSEANRVTPVHALTPEDLEALRLQEFQRDNETSRNRFFLRGHWTPSALDTLSGEWASWILRYDTPSDRNDDDRDEFQAVAKVRYSRRLSPILTVGAALSGQTVHTVFLKASRSSLNNQANVLRFSPFVHISGSTVSMHSRLEVLANYVIYDFEGEGAAVSSFGFRQISYRDSVLVTLTEKLRIEAPLLVRYFERSTLLWSDFAEIPQTGNLEYLLRFLLFSRPNATWDVGAGVRLYHLEQKTIQHVVGLPSVIGGVRSFAPEIQIQYQPSPFSSLTLNGWYEFQSPFGTVQREIPNIQLLARIGI
jgi:hypothetical protein